MFLAKVPLYLRFPLCSTQQSFKLSYPINNFTIHKFLPISDLVVSPSTNKYVLQALIEQPCGIQVSCAHGFKSCLLGVSVVFKTSWQSQMTETDSGVATVQSRWASRTRGCLERLGSSGHLAPGPGGFYSVRLPAGYSQLSLLN